MKSYIFCFVTLFKLSAEHINIEDLTEKSIEHALSTQNAIFIAKEGTSFPIEFFIDSDLFCLKNPSCKIELNKTIYLRTDGEKWLLSSDMNTWKACSDFFKGDISLGLKFEENTKTITVCGEMREN